MGIRESAVHRRRGPALRPEVVHSSRDVTADLVSYLNHAGWVQGPPGPVGSLWRNPDAPSALAVPDAVHLGTLEWSGIVERLSAWSRLSADDIAQRVEHQFIDVTRLRAANDIVIAGSIPLSAGQAIVTSAEAMLRAAGTTSVRLRGNINGNFSRLGDDVVAQARMGHTEEGSYVVPVLMPLSLADEGPHGEPPLDGIGTLRTAPEPAERRVTRTLAQALVALDAQVVQPARQVRKKELHPFVEAGGSREMVTALARILAEPSVATFEASFAWAGAVAAPAALPPSVAVPTQARELLEQTSRLMREMKISSAQVLSGPIVLIRMQPGDPFGEVAIQTIRNGRPCEVHFRLPAADIDRAHSWAIEKRAVLVQGAVRSQRGQPLMIDKPARVVPVNETMLPTT